MVSCNTNDRVKFKLTEYGVEVLEKYLKSQRDQYGINTHELYKTAGCGYNQSVRFAQYRNENWDNSSLDSKAFLLDYADKIEKEPDTLCLCIHPNEKLGMSCYCCKELSCRFAGYNSDGTIFDLGVRGKP